MLTIINSTMKHTDKRGMNIMIVIVYLMAIITLAFILPGCERKSGYLKAEKIVIIDSVRDQKVDGFITYKVKRIDHGVVAFVALRAKYETGDTIYYTFK